MPAYVVYRPSVLRSGRFGVRAAAVAALLIAATAAFMLLTRSGGEGASSGTHAAHAHSSSATAAALARKAQRAKGTSAKTHAAKVAKSHAATAKPVHHAKKTVVPAPVHTPVAVLNGGTTTGAAAAIAGRLRTYGYPVPVVGNAGRRDLPSAIEYSQGLGAAARALARKIGPVRYVTPFDGPDRNLDGAHLLVIVGY